MPNQHLIFGPPGTGKTTRLLGLVEQASANGVPTDRIGYLAFTKRAATEARDRAKLPGTAPWFRTIHSLCFAATRMTRQRMIGRDNWRDFEQAYGLQLGRAVGYEPTVEDDGLGAMLMHLYDQARIRSQSLRERYEQAMPDEVTMAELEMFAELYGKYKMMHGVYDFTDLLRTYMTDPTVRAPRLELLIVDEAQDLSALQWQVVEKTIHASGATDVYVAGDDDQAIFRWAGADTNRFLALRGTSEVLQQSYRVPRTVHSLATRTTGRIHKRQPKTWQPRDANGVVRYYYDACHVDYSSGQWLVLARDNYLLQPVVDHLKESGFLYLRNFEPALPPGSMEAITGWERIRRGKPARGDRAAVQRLQSVRLQKRYVSMNRNILPPWYVALDLLSDRDAEYLRAALRRGEDTRNPRITVSTIHGAKGAEADNVVLITDVSPRAADAMDRNPDDEHRVLYVGLTRAKEQLIVIEAETDNHYDL